MDRWLAIVKDWVVAHPTQSVAGAAFLVGLLVYIGIYRRLPLLLRLLFGLAVLGLGGWFGWAMLQTIDLEALGPAVGGVLGVLFLFTLLDDLDGGGYGRIGPGGRIRFWHD